MSEMMPKKEYDIQVSYDTLKRIHASTNEATADLQERNKILEEEIVLLNERLVNCQKALDINKEIMKNALTRQNEVQERYGKEVAELKEKIKVLENS